MSSHADYDFEHFPRLSGRMNRGSYVASLIGSVFGCAVWVAVAEKYRFNGWVIAFFVAVFAYSIFWATFRRSHDIGWWGITGIIPPMPLLLLMIPGNEGENAYGPQPTRDTVPSDIPLDQPTPTDLNENIRPKE
jgi:hypothetical protein